LTKVFFVTDLHASDVCFRKFLSATVQYKADAAIVGGDLTGKAIIPIISQSSGDYEYEFMGQRWTAAAREIESVETRIRNSGSYYCRVSPDEAQQLASDPRKLEELFLKLTLERLEQWIRIADPFLKSKGRKVLLTGGNDDRLEVDPILKKSESLIDCEGQVVQLDSDHEMISTGYSNISPWKCPRDITEDELARKIESMTEQVRDMQNCIFNFHCPPVDSGLDSCPKLDDSVFPPKPVLSAGSPVMFGAGSTAVKAAIQRHQPILGLHGHIHESRGAAQVGRTLCLNPGSEYAEGVLRGAIVTLDKSKIRGYQLTSG
jgi:Icc-related predicted phosphoesterase